MEIFPWIRDYSVGVAEFDSDHRMIVDYTNRLYSCVFDGNAKTEAVKIITGLMSFVPEHMQREDEAMIRFDYPLAAQHKASHDAFLATMNDFLRKAQERDGTLAMIDVAHEVSQYLKGWLAGHICDVDKELGRFLCAKGVR